MSFPTLPTSFEKISLIVVALEPIQYWGIIMKDQKGDCTKFEPDIPEAPEICSRCKNKKPKPGKEVPPFDCCVNYDGPHEQKC